MAKIDKETIANYSNSDELIDFIALNRYEPENQNILTTDIFEILPDYVQDIVFILDFETEFEMQGLYTLLENTTGKYLIEISKSFQNTQNFEISNLIDEVISISAHKENLNFENDKRFEQIEEQLSEHISEKDFWENVSKITDEKLNKNCP